MIGLSQYGEAAKILPPASYKLTNTTSDGRGVYSFCMCPGGQVVNASSECGRLVVNGMSEYARDGANANSAIVVTVGPEDFGEGLFDGMQFQRRLEQAAYEQGQGRIPVQLLGDFLQNRESTALGEVTPCLCGEYTLTNVRSILPKEIGDAIAESIRSLKDVSMDLEEWMRSYPAWRRERHLQSALYGMIHCRQIMKGFTHAVRAPVMREELLRRRWMG